MNYQLLTGMKPGILKMEKTLTKLEALLNKEKAVTYFTSYCSLFPETCIDTDWGFKLQTVGAEISFTHLKNLTGLPDYETIYRVYHDQPLSNVLKSCK